MGIFRNVGTANEVCWWPWLNSCKRRSEGAGAFSLPREEAGVFRTGWVQDGVPKLCESWFINPMNTIYIHIYTVYIYIHIISTIDHS